MIDHKNWLGTTLRWNYAKLRSTQNRAQTTQISLANLASKKLILSVLAWPSRSSFDTCPREDWMTCCKDKPKPSCWSYLLSTVNLYQFEQNAHVNVHKFCSPPIDWVGWTFQQHDGQIKFHGVFTKKFKCPGRKIHSKSQSSDDVFFAKRLFFQRTGNNCSSFTKLHSFFAYLDVALVFRYLCVFETGVTPKFQTESKQTSPMIDHGMGMGNTFGSQLRHCIFMMCFFMSFKMIGLKFPCSWKWCFCNSVFQQPSGRDARLLDISELKSGSIADGGW